MWWASHNADGGGYLIQRMAAAKDERHARGATLWFVVANNALRYWPWILTGLASLVLFPVMPEGQGEEAAYPLVMLEVLGPGLLGLLLVSLLRGLHVHHRHPSELGRQLPGQRHLPALPAARGHREGNGAGGQDLRAGDDGLRRAGGLLPDQHRQGLALRLGHGGGHRAGADPALVLVADQRLERDRGPGLVGAAWRSGSRSAAAIQTGADYELFATPVERGRAWPCKPTTRP